MVTTGACGRPVLVDTTADALVNTVMSTEEHWPGLGTGCRVAAWLPHPTGGWNYLELTELGQGQSEIV